MAPMRPDKQLWLQALVQAATLHHRQWVDDGGFLGGVSVAVRRSGVVAAQVAIVEWLQCSSFFPFFLMLLLILTFVVLFYLF